MLSTATQEEDHIISNTLSNIAIQIQVSVPHSVLISPDKWSGLCVPYKPTYNPQVYKQGSNSHIGEHVAVD